MTISRDVRLNVIAETRKYQQALAKVPGITEKQAGAAARRWEKALTDAAVRSAKEQSRQAVRVRKEQEKAADAAAKAQEKAAKDSGNAWADFGNVFAANLSADAIMSAASSIFDFASGIAEARTEAINLADATGISLETIAGLDVAAKRAGLTADEITGGFEDFGEVLFDFSNGGGRAAEALSALDVNVEKVGGGLRDTDDVLREVLNKLPKVEDQATRNAFAQQLFGDAGNRVNAALGDRALDDYIGRAKLFGTVVDGDAVAATAKWNETIGDLKTTLQATGGLLFDVFGEDLLRDLKAIPEAFVLLRAVGVTALEGLTKQAGDAAAAFQALFAGDFAEARRRASEALTSEDLVSFGDLARAAIDAQKEYRGLSNELDKTAVTTTKVGKTADQLAEEQKKAEAAARKHAAAQRELARDQERAARDFQKGIEDIANAIDSLQQIEDQANADTLSDVEAIIKARDEELARIDELERRIGSAAEADAARAAVIMRTTREIKAVQDEVRDDNRAKDEEDRTAAERDQEERLGRIKTWAEVTADALSTVTDLAADSFGRRLEWENELAQRAADQNRDLIAQRDELNAAIANATDSETKAQLEADLAVVNSNLAKSETILAEQRDTARRLFQQRKAMEIASITITGAAAALGALLPPPVGGGVTPIGATMAATASLATAGAIATVASQQMPQFDAGFASFTKGPDNFPALLRDGEGVTNQRATDALGGAAGIRELNQTGSMSRGATTIRLEVGGRELGRAIVDEMRAGRELAQKLMGGRRLGVRPVYITR
jgi:hypothetical protein